jgi:hypothetical protein
LLGFEPRYMATNVSYYITNPSGAGRGCTYISYTHI